MKDKILQIEDFNRIKGLMQKTIVEGIKELEQHPEKEKEIEQKALQQYGEYQNLILSSNLSEIPYEAYEGLHLLGDVDFSGTKANIDFNILSLADVDFIKVHGCSLRNIEEIRTYRYLDDECFDEQQKKENPSMFLSPRFSKEFRTKYYKNKLTIEDFLSLTEEQLVEIEEKGYLKKPSEGDEYFSFYRSSDSNINLMIEMLGVPKAVALYKERKEDFEEILALFSLNTNRLSPGFYHYDIVSISTASTLRENSSIESLKDTLYQIVREKLLDETYRKLRIEQFTPSFLAANEDIFLLEKPLPKDLRERYYNGDLSYEDIANNVDLFKNSRYSVRLNDYSSASSSFIRKVGEEKFLYLLEQHKDIFDYINRTSFGFSAFTKYIPNFETIVDDFPIIVSKYIRRQCSSDLLYRKHQLPDWASSMNYRVIDRIYDLKELLEVDSHTFIIDEKQAQFIETLGIKNILKFERETSCIRKSSDSVSEFMRVIGRYLSDHNQTTPIKDYDQFLDTIFNAITDARKKGRYCPLYRSIEGPLREKYQTLFLDNDLPQEFQNSFYNNRLEVVTLKKYLPYIPRLIGKTFRIAGDYQVIYQNQQIDFQEYYIQKFGQEKFLNLLLKYGPYATIMNKSLSYDLSGDEKQLEEEVKKSVYQHILETSSPYYETLQEGLGVRESFPQLFLPDDVHEEIKNLFYNRKITREELMKRKDLLNYFTTTNIAFGFEKHGKFLAQLYSDISIQEANYRRVEIYNALCAIEDDPVVLNTIENYIKNNEYDKEKIREAIAFASRIVHSNSADMRILSSSILSSIIEKENREESLTKIEDVFTKNNLPFFVKIYTCFQILNPNLEAFDFTVGNSKISPELKSNNLPTIISGLTPNETRMQIIFNDILRVTCHSNSRELAHYLDNLALGTQYYNEITENSNVTRTLSNEEQEELTTFAEHLETLYRYTRAGRENKIDFTSMSLSQKIKVLGDMFQPTKRYDLKDRIVRSFAYYAGIESFEQLKSMTTSSLIEADKRGRNYAKRLAEKPFRFENGDFIRGIGDYKALGGSLQYGNFSKEFLTPLVGRTVISDRTPLDIDLTLITKETDIYHSVAGTPTGFSYGNIYIVLKHDNPAIQVTRDKENNEAVTKYDPSKMEVFRTYSEEQWGARTGIGYTDVDYIMYKPTCEINPDKPYDENGNVNYIFPAQPENCSDLPAVKFEIARNGFYIPVIDFSGKLIFSPQEYEELRSKMQGLSHYGISTYQPSPNLSSDEIALLAEEIPAIESDNKRKKDAISATIKKALSPLGLTLKEEMETKLTTGTVEFIDTGSTARNTNIPGKGDFDYIMRLDNRIMSDSEQLQRIKDRLIEVLGEEHRSEVLNGNFRFKNVRIDGIDEPIKIDISFIQKTDKITYSSDEALKDRLQTIKTKHPEKYNTILANIIEAKRTLKEGEVYKKQQGGISGIGIENWILQFGGSFSEAAQSFLKASEGKTVEEFKVAYPIWDFGKNHYSDEKGFYPYDNFTSNLTTEGYKKMKSALAQYLAKDHNKSELNDMLSNAAEKPEIAKEHINPHNYVSN